MSSASKPPIRRHDPQHNHVAHHDHAHDGCCGGHAVNADPRLLEQLKQRLQELGIQQTPPRQPRNSGTSDS